MSDDPSIDWEDLVARVRTRDQRAAKELVDTLYPQVVRIVRAHLPRRMAEEDLCQEVFMKMFAKLDQFSGAVPFNHWVARMAYLTCVDQLRRQKVRPELRRADLSETEMRSLDEAAADMSAADPAHAAGAKELLARLLDTLSAEDRLVITLLELEGKSIDDVAEATGWNRTLIRVRAFRARNKLKKALEKLNQEEQR